MTKPCPDDLAAFKHEPADYEPIALCDEQAAAPFYDHGDVRFQDKLVQAFARHRTQANEAMREALERIAATDFDSPPWQAVEAEIKQIARACLDWVQP